MKRTSTEHRQKAAQVAADFLNLPQYRLQAFGISIIPCTLMVDSSPLRLVGRRVLDQLAVEVSAHSVVDIDNVVIHIFHDGFSQRTAATSRYSDARCTTKDWIFSSCCYSLSQETQQDESY